MTFKKVLSEGLKPVKIWTNDIEDGALGQLHNLSQLPFIHKHIAVMPDVHWGMGATIGSVIATKGAVIPAAVGVDLGCGMMAVKTTLNADTLPDNLHSLRSSIEAAIPHGRSNNGKAGDCGSFGDNAPKLNVKYWHSIHRQYQHIIEKHPKSKAFNTWNQMGTLGGGNHFIEICLDENNDVWIMLHSGSRGAGNKIGMYFINLAKKEMEKYHIDTYLPDKDLSYFVEHTEIFEDYCEAVFWAQDFAERNRQVMMQTIIAIMRNDIKDFDVTETAINCHHNYISRENHFGSNVIVTRKGAIRARENDFGIIPGSMGAKSFIIKGKGNKDSFCSCSHGAGRKMSRKEAHRRFTTEDLIEQTKGIECPKDITRVDEIPSSYKDIDTVMENQNDLVEIIHTLKQVVNIKG